MLLEVKNVEIVRTLQELYTYTHSGILSPTILVSKKIQYEVKGKTVTFTRLNGEYSVYKSCITLQEYTRMCGHTKATKELVNAIKSSTRIAYKGDDEVEKQAYEMIKSYYPYKSLLDPMEEWEDLTEEELNSDEYIYKYVALHVVGGTYLIDVHPFCEFDASIEHLKGVITNFINNILNKKTPDILGMTLWDALSTDELLELFKVEIEAGRTELLDFIKLNKLN